MSKHKQNNTVVMQKRLATEVCGFLEEGQEIIHSEELVERTYPDFKGHVPPGLLNDVISVLAKVRQRVLILRVEIEEPVGHLLPLTDYYWDQWYNKTPNCVREARRCLAGCLGDFPDEYEGLECEVGFMVSRNDILHATYMDHHKRVVEGCAIEHIQSKNNSCDVLGIPSTANEDIRRIADETL